MRKTGNRQSSVDFVKLILEFRKRKDEVLVSDLVKELLDKTGLTEMYRADGDEERLENIKELQNAIIALENDDLEKLTLENYLQEIALYTDMDVDDDKLDRVKLMTIHTAKGLEFPYVFLCGFSDGVLPSYMSMKERRLEEERRLTYVAITRAEKAFYMTESEGYNFQTGMYKYPSRFLWELKENLYVRQGILPQEIIDLAKKQIELESELLNPKPIPVLEVGDIVSFSAWGKGVIIEKDNEKKIYMIEFEKINGVRPIRFDWSGLRKLEEEENSIDDSVLVKEGAVDIEMDVTNNRGGFIPEFNHAIEKEQLKEDTFISNVKKIFKIK